MVLRLHYAVLILFLLVSMMLISSCASNSSPTGQSSQMVVRSSMKQLGVSTNVTTVRLIVTGEGEEEILLEDNFEEGVVTFEFEVPSGVELTFTMSALDAEGTTLYSGTATRTIESGSTAEIDITMTPQVPMVRVSPLYAQFESGTVGQVSIEIHNVDDLFGVSFRVEFDPTVIQFNDIAEGSIFDPNETIFFVRDESDYVAVAQTMQGNQSQQGVDGGGEVAIISFTEGSAGGVTDIVINPETLSLVDWQGNQLPATGRLYIENGEVEVIE